MGQQFSWIELTGTVFGLAGVLFTVQKNILCFPSGLINVALYAYLFFQARLYADSFLQLFYIILLIYGWVEWTRITGAFTPEKTVRMEWWCLGAVTLIFSVSLGMLLRNYTNASLPFLDSFLTGVSLAAQWMVAKKKIENWLVWIAADILYTGMYFYKGLYLTGILYFIFILLAIAGYREWKKKLAVNEAAR